MGRFSTGIDVLAAARQRIALAFDNFPKVCVSFSAGKDSTVLLHLVMDEAIKRRRRVAVLLIDLEAQYRLTMLCAEQMFEHYKVHIEPFWIALPIHLRNAVSVYQPFWLCWDPEKKESWVREPHPISITDPGTLPFFKVGMEFEEFVPEFAAWYATEPTAFFIGIRCDESYSRFLAIASSHKATFSGHRFTTEVANGSFNFYPLYDWKTEDIWTYHAMNPGKIYNQIYDLMFQAGVPLPSMRICQPYGDDQRKGLWLFHLLEPTTWGKVVARVNGANGGSLYAKEHGNVNGYRSISKPDHLTWQEFAVTLVSSMPKQTKEHYQNKIGVFIRWWKERGYPDGIPDEADYDLEIAKKVPAWRRICKTLLRNDWLCKGLGFTQQRSQAYDNYLQLMRKRRASWSTDSALLSDEAEISPNSGH